jgi:hypothetical protein
VVSADRSWYVGGVAITERPANTGKHPLERARSKAEDRAVERLRRSCLALPRVTEKIAWGELTWRVGRIQIGVELSQRIGWVGIDPAAVGHVAH